LRIYLNFRDALSEIKRDLAEMGIKVSTQTMQDVWVAGDPDYETTELQNYDYAVTYPQLDDLNPTQPWADAEFEERVSGVPRNPGEAWKLRQEVWEPFREDYTGEFAYTYAERMTQRAYRANEIEERTQLNQLVYNLDKYPDNRNHVLSIWGSLDLWRVGKHRVPCSLSYHFLKRDGALMMSYQQRSADFVTHLVNDIYLAAKLQQWVANKLNWTVGRFTHVIGSLHAYKKDLQNVF